MQTAKKSFLQRLFNFSDSEKRSTTYGASASLMQILGWGDGKSITVSEQTASTLTAIARAQSIIADGIATMPLKDYRKVTAGKEEVTDSAVTALLREPVSGMTGYSFRRLLTLWAVRYGNGLAYIIKDKGEPIALIPILPENVKQPSYYNGQWYYSILDPKTNTTFTLSTYEVVHIRYNSENGFWGVSPLVQHARSLGISLNAEKYGLDYFKNGAKPSFYASTPAALSSVDRSALQSSLQENFVNNSNGFVMLDNNLMLHSVSTNPTETQFAEVRAYGIAEASRIYGVPKYMLADASDSSYTNSETEYISFYNGTLMAHAICQEQEYSLKLYTEKEKASGRYLKHNFNALMRADSTTRAAFYGSLFRMGVLSTNDIRAFEDLNAVEEGNTRFTDANLIPLSKFDEFYDAKISVLIGQDLADQANNQTK